MEVLAWLIVIVLVAGAVAYWKRQGSIAGVQFPGTPRADKAPQKYKGVPNDEL